MDRALVFGHDENADVNMNDGSPTRGNPIKNTNKALGEDRPEGKWGR